MDRKACCTGRPGENGGMNRLPSKENRVPDAVPALARRLGIWSSIGVVIGVTIGSGIFRTPAVVAARVPDPLLMLGVWGLGGFITLCGALSVAELSAAFPQTGGLYVYLREGWGKPVAFLFGWSELVLIRASALGGIATVFAEYCLRSLGMNPASQGAAVHYLAAAAILFAAAVNIRGVHWGAGLVGVTTVGKLVALGVLVAAAFLLGAGRGGTYEHFTTDSGAVSPGLFGLALISVLWAYDGWADLSFVGGEVRDASRNLPRALVAGTLAIIGIYLITNIAYLYISPIAKVMRSPLVAADTMAALFGGVGVAAVSVLVMVSTFSSLNGAMLAAPRVFFAMAADGIFFKPLARVHAKYQTPYVAIGLSALLGAGFVLTRTFEQLSDTFVLTIWPFYAFSVAALYRVRRRSAQTGRRSRVPGYPATPALFIIAVIYLVANALLQEPLWTGLIFGVVLLGIPVYWACFGFARGR